MDFGNIFDRLKEFGQFPHDFSFEDFLDADTNVAAEATLTDTDILEQVRQNDVEVEEDRQESAEGDQGATPPAPTSAQAAEALNLLHHYFEFADVDENDRVFSSLCVLDSALQKCRSRKQKQNKITDYYFQ